MDLLGDLLVDQGGITKGAHGAIEHAHGMGVNDDADTLPHMRDYRAIADTMALLLFRMGIHLSRLEILRTT